MEDLNEVSFYECEICAKVYRSKQILKSHMNNIHKAISCSAHKCDICDKEFDRKDYLI